MTAHATPLTPHDSWNADLTATGASPTALDLGRRRG